MKMFEVNEKGEFVKVGHSLRSLIKNIREAAERVSNGDLKIPFGWDITPRNTPSDKEPELDENGNPKYINPIYFEVDVPPGLHLDEIDNDQSMINTLENVMGIIMEVMDGMLGNNIKLDPASVQVNITGGGGNIAEMEFIEYCAWVLSMMEGQGNKGNDFSNVTEEQRIETTAPTSGGDASSGSDSAPGSSAGKTPSGDCPGGDCYQDTTEGDLEGLM